jgi:hypothetical protein
MIVKSPRFHRFLERKLARGHFFHVSAKGVCSPPRDRYRYVELVRVLLTYGHLRKPHSLLQRRAKIFVQPHHDVLFACGLRERLEPTQGIVQRLAASNSLAIGLNRE